MSDATTHLLLPYILAAQAQKHVTHNEALRLLDGLVQLSVLDRDLTLPPGSPANGDRYIVGSGATGDWAGWDLNVAIWTDGAWLRLPPRTGWRAWVEDEGLLLVYNGAGWVGTTPAALQDLALLGLGTTADTSNPFSAKLNAALWTARPKAEGGTGDLFYTMNKEATGDDLGLTLQTGFVTKALVGLFGSDRFRLAVSVDGSTFFDGLSVDNATGIVDQPRLPRFKAYTNYDNYVGVGFWTKIGINNTDYDDQGAFDAANNHFVAPVDGTYLFGATLLYKVNASTSARMSGRLVLNGSTEIRGSRGEISGAHVSEATALWLQTMMPLTAGDTVELQGKFRAADGYFAADHTSFWGRRWGEGGALHERPSSNNRQSRFIDRPLSANLSLAQCNSKLDRLDRRMARALVARSLICAFVLLSFGSVAHGKSASDRPSLQGSSLESGPVLAQVSEYSRDQIRQLQRWLSDLGYDAGEPDGVIGGRTTRAVRAFEADRGRAPLGIITDEIFDLVADDWMAHTGTLARQSGNSGIRGPETGGASSHVANENAAPTHVAAHLTGCAGLIEAARFAAPASVVEYHPEDYETSLENDLATEEGHYFTGADEDILLASDRRIEVAAGDGNDRLFVFSNPTGSAFIGEGGGDEVHVCALTGPFLILSTNDGQATGDSDPDTIVIHAGAFAMAESMRPTRLFFFGEPKDIDGAEIAISGYDARTDRTVLRMVEPAQPQVVSSIGGITTIDVGPLRLQYQSVDLNAPNPLASIAVERVSPEELAADMGLAERIADGAVMFDMATAGPDAGNRAAQRHGHAASPVDGGRAPPDPASASANGTCDTLTAWDRLDRPVIDPTPEAHDSRKTIWRDGNDLILHRGTGEAHWLSAFGGDDQIWLFDVSPDTGVYAGVGADLIVICSMADTFLNIWAGTTAWFDHAPDTIVIDPAVLKDVPAGFQRHINVWKFHTATDRLVLPPSPGMRVEVSTNGPDSVVNYGPLRIRLGHEFVPDRRLVRAAIQIGTLPARPFLDDMARRKRDPRPAAALPLSRAGWSAARTVGGGPAHGPAPMHSCDRVPAPQAATQPIGPPDFDDHWGLSVTFGDGDDVIVLRAIDADPTHGVLSETGVMAGAGDDLVFVETAELSLHAGSGADTIVICAMDGLEAAFVAAKDGAPDTLIVDSGVFLTPLGDRLLRSIAVEGFVEPHDRVVLRVPEGFSYEWLGFGFDIGVSGFVTRVSFSPAVADGPSGGGLDLNKVIVWPVASEP